MFKIYQVSKMRDYGTPNKYFICYKCESKVWVPNSVFRLGNRNLPMKAVCSNKNCRQEYSIPLDDYVIIQSKKDD